jgi:hypothetical protein
VLESDKYAYVNIGGGAESVYVRIKKDTPIPEADKPNSSPGRKRRVLSSLIENAYCVLSKGVQWGLGCWSEVVKEAINMALKS